jgi:hypothetical protein
MNSRKIGLFQKPFDFNLDAVTPEIQIELICTLMMHWKTNSNFKFDEFYKRVPEKHQPKIRSSACGCDLEFAEIYNCVCVCVVR